MKKNITRTISLFLLLITQLTNAQVLFNENFDSYPTGHLLTNYLSTTPQQGGWYSGANKLIASIKVTPEVGKGNVIVFEKVGSPSIETVNLQQLSGLAKTLWNSRMPGYNICKFEFDFMASGQFNASGGLASQGPTLINVSFALQNAQISGNYWDANTNKSVTHTNTLLLNTWYKGEMFIDYNTKLMYFYLNLPTQQIKDVRIFNHSRLPEDIYLSVSIDQTGVVKYDNIKLTALQSLPEYLLQTNEWIAAKFTIFPNPVANVLTVSSNENTSIQQLEIYDTNGKQVYSVKNINKAHFQLNIEKFSVGTYMLHVTSDLGTAVKKFIKQ
ncbi:T9SS type A sorting domain-containing protein [Myroides sp. JBRI-B21084]|uniref:T9SS type A sorting domain-containing protein n=1 Tax=Myroides sp. JBRI-B21084 TaxID=3119977 RepID=UPI0026E2C973|nr:T9SS type A sorting domain-containing protein [Paenimyroides cloacae]WKW46946.1 T9SS type A sorting domain-containing protein [Paenimyroides cloacae]